MRITPYFGTLGCVLIINVSALAQLSTPARYATRFGPPERLRAATEKDIALFGTVAAQFVDKRAYVQTAPLAGYFAAQSKVP